MRVSWEHAYGAMLGLFVGDAAGATLEFIGYHITPDVACHALSMPGGGIHGVGPGQVSDDSELAIALAIALSAHHPSRGFPADAVAQQYTRWYESKPFDVGITCSRAFRSGVNLPNNISPAQAMRAAAARSSQHSESNGALMRITPLAIWAASLLPDDVAQAATQDAALTHPNSIPQECNAIYAVAMSHLLTHIGDVDGAIAVATPFATCSAVRRWFLIDSANENLLEWLDCAIATTIGHVRHAFTLAFYFLRRRTSFHDAILQTLLKGGDTDTNACIVGALVGALHSAQSIPSFMKDPVLHYNCSTSSNELLGQVRPITYSPTRIKEILTSIFYDVEENNGSYS